MEFQLTIETQYTMPQAIETTKGEVKGLTRTATSSNTMTNQDLVAENSLLPPTHHICRGQTLYGKNDYKYKKLLTFANNNLVISASFKNLTKTINEFASI